MGIVFFVFVVERFELFAIFGRLFPVRNKLDKPALRHQLARHFSKCATRNLISPKERKPGNKARTLLAQIAENRWPIFGVAVVNTAT